MNIAFGEVLRRTWKIGWNHKVLWLYQMLPGLLVLPMMPLFLLGNPGFTPFLPGPFDRSLPIELFLVLNIVGTLIMIILAMFLGTLVQGATTFGALEADRGAAKLGFRETIKQSLPYFWRVFGLYALFGTVWALVILGFMALNIGASVLTFGLGNLCLIPFFFLLIPLVLVGYSIMELAQAAIIVENLNVRDAIKKGWQVFRANILGIVLLMIMLYFALSIISSMIVFPMMLPMAFLPIAFENSADLSTPFILIFFVFFPLMMIIMTVVQGILMAFFQSAWAVTYLRLNHDRNMPVFAETDVEKETS